MLKHETVLFDLDGTLTDPGVGITNSVAYALSRYGITVADRKELYPFIGPPLMHSFRDFYGMDEAIARQAVGYYREYFQDQGIYENELYPGIDDLLNSLQRQGRRLALATSKPTVFAEKVLLHFDLLQYFPLVVGSNLDGTRVEKVEVIAHTLSRLGKPTLTLMVGDRKYDIMAAHQLGIDALAAGYGYGSREELMEAKPDYIADTVADLQGMFVDDK
ncbi:MAG: HAD-IA family hydrolase [Methylocystaceae bacterium]